MAQEYRHIGKATQRLDAEDIVSGDAVYIDDLRLPNMLYGKVLRSPYPHANIIKIDTTKAEKFPGVEAVITHQNAPDWRDFGSSHIHVLDSRVRYVGDAVALAAAKTADIAEEALELIDVEYEQLPAVYDAEEAISPDAPQLYDDCPGNTVPRSPSDEGRLGLLDELVIGDIQKGLAEADFITEGTYTYENNPNPLAPEPPGVIALWHGPKKVTVWSSTQCPHFVRDRIKIALNMPDLDVRSIGLQCGGGFGTKICPIHPVFYALALSKAVGRGKPVKIVYSKEEHFNTFVLRFGSRINGKVGIKKDGTVTAFAGDWMVTPGCIDHATKAQIAVGLGEAQVMLRCDNWNIQPKIIFSNRTASAEIRGFGGQELKSAFIPMLSIAMEEAGIDPVDFFKRNFVKPGEKYLWKDRQWWTSRGIDFTKAIEKGAELFGWQDKWQGWGQPTAVNGPKRVGIGCGVHGNPDVGENRSEAYVRLLPEGRAVLHTDVAEPGGGQRSSVRKMVAELLNLALDKVNVTPLDTLINPWNLGLTGSRGTYTVGSSATRAAEDARQKLFAMAAEHLNTGIDNLYTKDGMIFNKNKPEDKISWAGAMTGSSPVTARTITGFGSFDPDYSLSNFFMTFAEVEVDIETGEARLLRVVGATDVGQIIDTLALENQLFGALGAAGLDTALLEETVIDKNTGHILSGNMMDYKWRTFLDLPEFQNLVMETPLPSHVFHAVGVGEITTSPGPSAVLMAVSNAIGTRMKDYPVTPEKVLRALGKIK